MIGRPTIKRFSKRVAPGSSSQANCMAGASRSQQSDRGSSPIQGPPWIGMIAMLLRLARAKSCPVFESEKPKKFNGPAVSLPGSRIEKTVALSEAPREGDPPDRDCGSHPGTLPRAFTAGSLLSIKTRAAIATLLCDRSSPVLSCRQHTSERDELDYREIGEETQ